MTTDEVNQLIDQEIYENQQGHITGTLLSSVLHAINEKKIDFYKDLGSNFNSNLFDSAAIQLYPLPYQCSGNGVEYFKSALFASVVDELKLSNYAFNSGCGETVEFVATLMNNIGFQYKVNKDHLVEFSVGISNTVLDHYIQEPGFASSLTNQIGKDYTDNGYQVRVEFASGISTAILDRYTQDQMFAASLTNQIGLNYLYGGYPIYGDFASGISTAILEHCGRDHGFASYLASALRSYL